MILHFKDVSGSDYLNINFTREIYNDIPVNAYFSITVSPDDMHKIKRELDFNCFDYSTDDETLTQSADDLQGAGL